MSTRTFEATVLPHLDAAFNYARWLTRNDAEAEDVVQDACVRALRFFSSLRDDDARAWLFAIVRNTYFSQVSRRPLVTRVKPLDEDGRLDGSRRFSGPPRADTKDSQVLEDRSFERL